MQLVETIATVMKGTGEHAAFYATHKPANRGAWLGLPYAYDQATKAAITILDLHKPPVEGEIAVPVPKKIHVVGGDPEESMENIRRILEDFGPLIAHQEMREREEGK